MPVKAVRNGLIFVALTGGGIVWLVHLSTAYTLVAVGCPRAWPAPGLQIAGLTLLCGSAALAVSVTMLQRRRRLRQASGATISWESTQVFLGVGGALAVLFAVLVVAGGMVAVVLPPCHGVAIGGAA